MIARVLRTVESKRLRQRRGFSNPAREARMRRFRGSTVLTPHMPFW